MPVKKMRESVELEGAVEVFVRGFGVVRSMTHPYLLKRVGELWWLSDAERRSGNHRRDEWVVCGIAAREVDRVARATSKRRFCLSVIVSGEEAEERARREYKELGYRLGTTELMFVHRLARIPRAKSSATMVRVETVEMAERLAKEAGRRQINLREGSGVRQYVALLNGEMSGWVKSVEVPAQRASWVSNLHVKPAYRRRGIGGALMCRMLRDDRAAGMRRSVLTASHVGAKLYPGLGYETVGKLMLFTPRRA